MRMDSILSHEREDRAHHNEPFDHTIEAERTMSSSFSNDTTETDHIDDATSGGSGSTTQDGQRKVTGENTTRTLWQTKRSKRRERVKMAAKLRKVSLQAEWESLSSAAQAERRAAAVVAHSQRRVAEHAHHLTCTLALQDSTRPTLVFDLSFAWCMTPAATRSTVAQIKYAYSTLHHAGFPLRPCITSLTGKEVGAGADAEQPEQHDDSCVQAQELRGLLSFAGFARYPPVAITEEHWSRLFALADVVMLTADAKDEVLQRIEPNTVYVIGAFVDHNRYKGLTLRAAQRHGVRVARLPIDENIEIGNRCKVLTINHVVDILTRFVQSNQTNWKSAFLEVLPTRRAN